MISCLSDIYAIGIKHDQSSPDGWYLNELYYNGRR